MKKLSIAIALTVLSVGIAPAQRMRGHEKAAVVEFSPAPGISAMTHESKRYLQASIASLIVRSEKLDIVDTRHTREASQSILADVNNETSTTAAVKVGKQLGVRYVLTGTVAEYDPKGGGGLGSATLRARLVDVTTGRVAYSGEFAQKGLRPMYGTGTAEMQANVLKPAVVRLVDALAVK